MYIIKAYYSELFGTIATIEERRMRSYKGAEESIGYRLCCYATYDYNELYYCVCFSSFEEAYNEMMKLSCGEWKEYVL